MTWYDFLIIFFFVLGILMVAFSSFHNKKLMLWGLLLIIASLIAKVSLWLADII